MDDGNLPSAFEQHQYQFVQILYGRWKQWLWHIILYNFFVQIPLWTMKPLQVPPAPQLKRVQIPPMDDETCITDCRLRLDKAFRFLYGR